MMHETIPAARKDLELFPVQQGAKHFILIKDHLGLVEEGKAVSLPLYQVLTLLNGSNTIRDLQTELMRRQGGVLIGTEEIKGLITHLDESFLIDSVRFREARDRIITDFALKKVRPCTHCGRSYPNNPSDLENWLNETMASQPAVSEPQGKVKALVAPHIDLSVGYKVYSSAYKMLRFAKPQQIVVLGTGHQIVNDLFCLTEKDFDTPLGVVKNEKELVKELHQAGRDIVAGGDFAHRAEHSIEFQTLFFRHLLGNVFSIIPILCGSLQTSLPEYSRKAYLDKAGPFLSKLKQIVEDPKNNTILVAGVDFSHIGLKFGHEMPAANLKQQAEAHDKNLLEHLSKFNADGFWEESREIKDQYNVCGFSALACLLEVLPPCKGEILDYELWNEDATRSAVSYAAVVFTS